MSQQIKLRPTPLPIALLCFGVPAVMGMLGLYLAMPALASARVPLFWNYMLTVAAMFPLLVGATIVAYRLEGRQVSWNDLKRRFRLRRLGSREWLWTGGLLIVYVGGQLLLLPTAGWRRFYPYRCRTSFHMPWIRGWQRRQFPVSFLASSCAGTGA